MMDTEDIQDKLTDQQELFCHEYIKDLNATQAAIRAGYSVKSAPTQGPRLSNNIRIKARIAELQAKRLKRSRMKEDEIIEFIEDSLNINLLDWFEFRDGGIFKRIDENGKPIEMPREYGRFITKIHYTAYGPRVELMSKEKSLELITRIHGMLHDNTNVNITGAELLEAVRKRRAKTHTQE